MSDVFRCFDIYIYKKVSINCKAMILDYYKVPRKAFAVCQVNGLMFKQINAVTKAMICQDCNV